MLHRTREDLARAAAAAGAVLLSTDLVQLRDGTWTLSGKFGFDDPWAAARLLCILAEEDAADPAVAAWALSILEHTADALGLEPGDPRLLDAFAAAVHANVQTFIRFEPEVGEQFQSAATTMIEGVGDCDCQARLVHALLRSVGQVSEIRFFEQGGEPVHAVAAADTTDGPAWMETTIAADFGEHPQAAYRRLGLASAGARPDIGGSAHDDVVALQTRLEDAFVATALAVEACPGLPAGAKAQWDVMASQIVQWNGADPSSADLTVGQALADQLNAFAGVLRAAGCKAPIPAPIPKPPAPEPPAPETHPLAAAVKVVAVAVAVVAGAVAIVKVADVAGRRRRAVV